MNHESPGPKKKALPALSVILSSPVITWKCSSKGKTMRMRAVPRGSSTLCAVTPAGGASKRILIVGLPGNGDGSGVGRRATTG
jgi:hypothetical protein